MGEEVVKLFELMRKEDKVSPDSITLLSVLSGCSHGGLEERGLYYFHEMKDGKCGVIPNITHYGCIVDMPGRAGRVQESLIYVEGVPFLPTPTILGSLLGACRVHSNVDIGELVDWRLLELEPENAGNYVILSNLYASAERWKDVRNVRALMKEKTLTKDPGKSWVELDQTLHIFHASDRSHPRRKEVFEKMDLALKMKEVGYILYLSCVLYDVDQEQKEKILLGHSEKLTLTFGVIASTDGVTLREIKNLRICVDCHNFAKFLSKISSRAITLRDKNRFHHIVGGKCSCGDYW